MLLGDKIEKIWRLDIDQKKALHRLGLFSISDMLFYYPTRYSDISEIKNIDELIAGENATIYGEINKLKTKKAWKSKMPMAEGEVEDLTGKIKIIWFNQAYLAKMIKNGEKVKLTGKIVESKSGIYLSNPEFERVPIMPIDRHDSLFTNQKESGTAFPVYRETRGITSKWIYHAILKIINDKTLENIVDYIPKEILEKYNLPTLRTALIWIHTPKKIEDAKSARKRFAFEEVFFIQLARQKDKHEYKQNKSFEINSKKENIENFINKFPFTPTISQKNSIETILSDINKNHPMSRLLEGDVGSGKTAVAATATYATVIQRPNLPPPRFDYKTPLLGQEGKKQSFGNLQVAYMAPTEILASQHFESFIKYFEDTGIQIGLITGSGCKKFPSKLSPSGWTTISRAQLLKWVANGEIPILIGTHALIQKSVKFKDLALVVIDEQHRFGTAQRMKLTKKDNIVPHLLSMTATPIPRTLALTIYGDLDLSLLTEMPAGRKPIITEIITPDKREKTYEEIHKELEKGRQLYVICPRIAENEDLTLQRVFSPERAGFEQKRESEGRNPEPSTLGSAKKAKGQVFIDLKSVTAEAKRLKKEVFKNYEIGVLHSKMTKEKKEKVMQEFTDNKIQILVATSVIEVGVNVPNATVIIIEGAERFGLAQLHQLRGRVIRSNHQAYCYVFADAKTAKTIERLKALKTAKNGFELAELDLAQRGAGELGGTKQWGITDLGMEAIKNIKMVEAARTEAIRLISLDPELKSYPLLKTKVDQKTNTFHFE